jgi:hypothetical protein
MALISSSGNRSKNMESESIKMKFRSRNFVVDERGTPLPMIIGLIKSFIFACKSQATRIIGFPQKSSAFRLSQG